jgi:hypothetical protein
MRLFFAKNKLLLILGLLTVITIIINQFPSFIESFYSVGIYPYISRSMRFLLGWLPFSFGDCMYGIVAIWLLVKIISFFIKLSRGQLANGKWKQSLRKTAIIVMLVYVLFNWMWAFNYNRLGSAYQFQLKLEQYSKADLQQFADTIQSRLNVICKDSISLQQNRLVNIKAIKLECENDYALAGKSYPFIAYKTLSVKRATLGSVGNYLGFLGYVNPISLEAQLNQSIPSFFVPYVCCHEMAHQIGYASESEANLIGYMTCKQSGQPAFRYSVYYDLMNYALNEIAYRDTALAKNYLKQLPRQVKTDRKFTREFFSKYKNPISPMIDWAYDHYLKLNNQPHGKETYNEVVGWIIAYAKKYGWEKV